MKLLRYIFLMSSLTLFWSGYAQRAVVTANSYDISDNLDLQAVASIFGDSKSLEDFEYRLNDPNIRISNLDLNGDGYVDYLRVVETVEGRTHLVVVQAVLGQDMFQDVATIEVEKQKNKSKVYVQIVGNPYLYGANYIYEPVYVSTPPVFSLFWTNAYSPYYSTWSWGYYPSYYSYYRPYPTATYIVNVHTHINYNNKYIYTNNRYSTRTPYMYENVRQNYYERKNPNNSFNSRYSGYNNRHDLASTRSTYSRSEYSVNSSKGNNNGNNGRYRTVNSVSSSADKPSSSYSRSGYQTNSGTTTNSRAVTRTGNSSSTRAVQTTSPSYSTSRSNNTSVNTSSNSRSNAVSRGSYSTPSSSSSSPVRSNSSYNSSSSSSRSSYSTSGSSARSSSASSSAGRSSSSSSSSRSSYSR